MPVPVCASGGSCCGESVGIGVTGVGRIERGRETRWVWWVRWVRWIERRVGRAALLGEHHRRRQGLVVLVLVVVIAGVVELVLADVVPEVPFALACVLVLGLGLVCRSIRRSGFGAAELDGRHGRCERVLDVVLILGLVLGRIGIVSWVGSGIWTVVRLMILSLLVVKLVVEGLLLMLMVRAHREGGGRVDERGHVVCRYSSTLVSVRDEEEVESQTHRHRQCQCPHRPPHVLLTPVHHLLHDFESERPHWQRRPRLRPASPRASQTVTLNLMSRQRARVRVFVCLRAPEPECLRVRGRVHVGGEWRTRARACARAVYPRSSFRCAWW